MNSMTGGDRNGYVGAPPQRGGFGRRQPSLSGTAPADFTLSQASQPEVERHVAQHTLQNDIDFAISDGDMQHVEIELDPGEAVIAEPGAMIWKDRTVRYDMILGDGSRRDAGLASRIMNAGTNLIAGESLFLAEFRHEGQSGKARVGLGGRIPGHVIPVRLDAMGGSLICQRKSFLAAAKGVSVSVAMQRRLRSMIFGDEGFVMQRLTGAGWAFLHVGGGIIERTLGPGEVIHVDGGCVAAHEPQVEMDIFEGEGLGQALRTTMLGDESLFLTALRGPGKVWLQTLPFSRVASEMAGMMRGSSALSGASMINAGDIGKMVANSDYARDALSDGIKKISDLF